MALHSTSTSRASAVRRRIVDITLEPVLVDTNAACELLGGISKSTLDTLIIDGRITPKRIGTRVLITPEELRRFAATCPDWEPKT